MFNKISILGLGLIGGSIAKTIKLKKLANSVSAYNRSDKSIDLALSEKTIGSGSTNIEETLKNSDFIIICTHLDSYKDIFESINQNANKDAIISDIGSVKQSVINIGQESLDNIKNFVPAHPIAGSEQSGYQASSNDLFEDRKIIITPLDNNNQDAIDKVTSFWNKLGSKVEQLTSDEHDDIYAAISHLPQFLAFKYADSFFNVDDKEKYQQFLRLSKSNKAMWNEIFAHNQDSLVKYTKKLQTNLTQLLDLSEAENIAELDSRINAASKKVAALFDNRSRPDIHPEYELPSFIACALIESVTEKQIQYAGTGFKDFVSPIFW